MPGAIWTRGLYEPDWLLPERAEGIPAFTFFALADQTAGAASAQVRYANEAGRTTRALPLYFAESFLMSYAVHAGSMLFAAEGFGPAVFRDDPDMSSLAERLPESGAPRIVVAGGLLSNGVKLRAWEVDANRELCAIEVQGDIADPAALATESLRELVSALQPSGLLVPAGSPRYYRRPEAELLIGYLSALEQLVYQLLAANELVPATSLTNERGFFETYFELAERTPGAPGNAHLIAICGVTAAVTYGSTAVGPYSKQVLRWLDEAVPGSLLDRVAPAVLKRLGEARRLDAWRSRTPKSTDARYEAWLERIRHG